MRVPLYIKVIPVYIILMMMFAAPVIGSKQADGQLGALPILTDAHIKPIAANNEHEVLSNISAPSVGIDLEIIEGKLDKELNSWSVEDGVANFLPESSLPQENSGITILYAHDRDKGFKALDDLSIGDKVYLRTNKSAYTYRFINFEIVKPTNISVITNNVSTNKLALITCEGFWSSDRRIVYLKLED